MPARGDGQSAGAGGNDFGSRLQELKEHGCMVLVTGESSSDVHARICRRLLGDEARRRRRLLVFTNGTFGLETRLPRDGRSDDTEIITTSPARSAVAGTSSVPEIDVVELEDATLADLGIAIVDACRTLEDRHGPLEPAEMRFGLDSLTPLLDAHGEPAVFEFLIILTRYARAYDALGHVHLPVERDARVARVLAPLFDAIVEVHVRGGRKQHRWHLTDEPLTSRWLPI